MIFRETPLEGSFVIDIDRIEDERGFFARSFCQEEFARQGLDDVFVQCNISYNRRKGTVRGLHYQRAPYWESKLVRVTVGAIYDVIVDLRPGSRTFGHHFGVELSADSRRMLFVPEQFAHGFQTLADDTEVFYQMSTAFVPGVAAGIRYDDATIGVSWPIEVSSISDRDLDLPPFDPDNFDQ